MCYVTLLTLTVGLGGPQSAGPQEAPRPAAEAVKEPALRRELLQRMKRDQDVRMRFLDWAKKEWGRVPSRGEAEKLNSPLFQEAIKTDRENLEWLKHTVVKYGWPGRTLVGTDGAHAAWLLVQHADRDRAFQEHCLELMQKAPPGEVTPSDIAYLVDRVRIAAGRKQLYGTQVDFDGTRWVVRNVEEPERLEQRRKALGLEPLDVYLRMVQDLYNRQEKEAKEATRQKPK